MSVIAGHVCLLQESVPPISGARLVSGCPTFEPSPVRDDSQLARYSADRVSFAAGDTPGSKASDSLANVSGYVVLADARIDNLSEILETLDRSLRNRGSSPAEIVAHMYAQWGAEFVGRLRGDFALAVWDPYRECIVLARDALGARGISYTRTENSIVFATDVAALLSVGEHSARINEHAISRFLSSVWSNDGSTFFESIFECPPAHTLVISAEHIVRRRYWRLDPSRRFRVSSDAEYADRLVASVDASVHNRIGGESRVGVSLSGGLDSSLVAARVAHHMRSQDGSDAQAGAISWVFDRQASMDERRYIEPLAARLNMPRHELIADDLWTLRNLERWPYEPDFIWYDAQVQLSVGAACLTKNMGYNVLLDGQFGDQLFAGPYRWPADLLCSGDVDTLVRLVARYTQHIRWQRHVLGSTRALLSTCVRDVLGSSPRRSGSHPGLSDRLKAMLLGDLDLARTHRCERGGKIIGPGWREREFGVTAAWWPHMMTGYRRVYHRVGIARESPFYDRDVVETIMALPSHQIGHPMGSRWIQRNAMRGRVPAPIWRRTDKVSFRPLFDAGLLEKERSEVRRLLADPLIVQHGWVRPEWIRKELHAGANWSNSGWWLWLVLCVEIWLRRRAGWEDRTRWV